MVFQEEFLIFTLSQGKENRNCFIPHTTNFRHCDIPSYEKYLTIPLGEDMGYARGVGGVISYQDIRTFVP